MGGDRRTGVHHGVTQGPGLIAPGRLDPDSLQTKCRLFGGLSFHTTVDFAGIDGQLTAHFDFTTTTHHPVQNDVVSVGLQIQRIANSHGLHQKTQLRRQLFPHPFDAGHQLPTRLHVDQGNQAIANFQTDQVHLLDIIPVQLLGAFVGGQSRSGRRLLEQHLLAHDHEGHTRRGGSQCQEHQMGHARHQSQNGQNAGRNEQGRHIRELRGRLLRH